MCVASMVMEHYMDRWTGTVPPWTQVTTPPFAIQPSITDEEVLEFRRLLDRARDYDKRHGEPKCELDEKKILLLDLAEKLGMDISFINEAA